MNKKIVVAAFVITGSGVIKAITGQKSLTPVFIGGYVFLLVLALADTFGGPLSTLSGALAMLAMTYILLSEFPWSTVLGLVQGKKG